MIVDRQRPLTGESAAAVELRRSPSLAGLELKRGVVRCGYVAPHVHEAWQIGSVEIGATHFRLRRERHVAPAGTLMLISPGEAHSNESIGSRCFRTLYVSPDLLAPLSTRGPGEVAAVVTAPHVVDAWRRLMQGLWDGAEPLALETALLAAVHLLLSPRERSRRPSEHWAVAKIRAHLREHYRREVRLDELASLVGLNKAYLVEVFTTEVGIAPHRYLLGLRVEAAKTLLRQGMSAAQVALEVGFADQSHLIRGFKARTLLTPRHYARAATSPEFRSRTAAARRRG